MTVPRLFLAAAMTVVTATFVGFGVAHHEAQQRAQLSAELAKWQLEEWKDNLLAERHREFEEQRNSK
jgi:hypothetical protein